MVFGVDLLPVGLVVKGVYGLNQVTLLSTDDVGLYVCEYRKPTPPSMTMYPPLNYYSPLNLARLTSTNTTYSVFKIL